MAAFASATGGAIINGVNGSLAFGPGCNISNNTVTAFASTAAFATGSASAGGIQNLGNLSFGKGCRFENNLAFAQVRDPCALWVVKT